MFGIFETLTSLSFSIIILVYLSCLILWYVYHAVQTTISNNSRYKNAVLELHDAVGKNDVIYSMKIIEKYPQAMNETVDSTKYTPFLKACLNGNTHLVKYMLSKGADLNKVTANNETAFYLAAYNRVSDPGNVDASCLHTLYYAGVDINAATAKGYTPLQMAAIFGHTPLIKWLLAKGATTAVQPDPYLLARSRGHWKAADVLRIRRLHALI